MTQCDLTDLSMVITQSLRRINGGEQVFLPEIENTRGVIIQIIGVNGSKYK